MKIRANLVHIFDKKIEAVELTIHDGLISVIKPIDEVCETYILPGFIDAHIHIESSMLPPSEFARLALPHGSVSALCDPHEIANVLGVEGVEFMIDNSKKSPFKFYFGASPCVPATPFETSGSTLGVLEVETLLLKNEVKFLSEVMNFPGVINKDRDMLEKIALAKKYDVPVDGHAPGVMGEDLSAYIAAGITTDHEAFTYKEGLEKIQKGMKVLIREGSAAKNYEALHGLIDDYADMLMFCSDDRHPDDLLKEHINALVKRSLDYGHDLYKVLQIACINPIKHYNLDVGMLRVGDSADFIEIDNLKDFNILKTFIEGVCVAQNTKALFRAEKVIPINNFKAIPKSAQDFYLESSAHIEVIQAYDHELITHEKEVRYADFLDPSKDIIKIAIINRYEDKKPVVAYINGFGLKSGAMASSIAHDSHNILVIGCDDESLARCANLVIESSGGISALSADKELLLGLDVAGLMSSERAEVVAEKYSDIDHFVKDVLGSNLESPFMTLSFMALLVIPDLKLSDKGLFDGREFHFVSVSSEDVHNDK